MTVSQLKRVRQGNITTKLNEAKEQLMFEAERKLLLSALDDAHENFYQAEVFGGPSLHFHLKSLEAARAQDFERFAESVYAVLPSWGMHRMGGGPKMQEFAEFHSSLKAVWPIALRLRDKTPADLGSSDWNNVREVFRGIHCMASSISLVGNSKVMAHLLPNLVPPVDREYTLNFLFRRAQIVSGIEVEWRKLVEILEGFFYPVSQSAVFQSKAEKWLSRSREFKWDTSPLKIADNLVIGISRMARAAQSADENTLQAKDL